MKILWALIWDFIPNLGKSQYILIRYIKKLYFICLITKIIYNLFMIKKKKLLKKIEVKIFFLFLIFIKIFRY